MSEEITNLEIKIMHLEQANQELSDVYYDQQKQLTALQAQIELLKSQMKDIKETEVPNIIDEPPPHY